jgi:hypothetical protein
MLVSTLLVRAVGEEIEKRGLTPNKQFMSLQEINSAERKLNGMLPQLGISFATSDTSYPYSVRWEASFPFILATPTMVQQATDQAKALTEEFYLSMTKPDEAPVAG